jgi:hypothetical protein
VRGGGLCLVEAMVRAISASTHPSFACRGEWHEHSLLQAKCMRLPAPHVAPFSPEQHPWLQLVWGSGGGHGGGTHGHCAPPMGLTGTTAPQQHGCPIVHKKLAGHSPGCCKCWSSRGVVVGGVDGGSCGGRRRAANNMCERQQLLHVMRATTPGGWQPQTGWNSCSSY